MVTPNERSVLTKLLALQHPTTPQTNRFHLRKLTMADFTRSVELRGQLASPPKPTGTLKAFGDDLKPVMGDDSGGVFVEWTVGRGERPILYLSSEGAIEVAGSDAGEMFGLFACTRGPGWDLFRAMTVAAWELTELDEVKPAHLVANLIEGPQAGSDDDVVAIMAAHDVPVAADVLPRIRAATERYLWAFIDRLDTIVTGYPAQRTWFEAWNRADADVATTRAFSPKERYTVGDRITYTWKAQSLPPQRAVVLAHPQPNRVLLADRSTTFLRAYT